MEKATYIIIDICLHPDNELNIDENAVENPERMLVDQAADQRASAEGFLNLLSHHHKDERYYLAETFIRMHTTDKSEIQSALNKFQEMAFDSGNKVRNVGAVFGVARAYMLLKQVQKAKTALKTVNTKDWNFDDANYLEKCWLLLADIYISQNKNEQAIVFLETVLRYNCNSLKAFELYGYMKEKEQKYVEAYKMYEKAFLATKERNPAFGR